MKPKKGEIFFIVAFSKFFILFLVFAIFFLLARKSVIHEKFVVKKDNYQKVEQTNIQSNMKIAPTASAKPVDWSVEKVDEHLTRVSMPADSRMSTPDELFAAINDYRKAHGVQQVQKNDLICGIAQSRANEQQTNGDLDGHAGFNKFFQNQEEFPRMGEVLFGGGQPQLGVHIVEYGWNRSLTGHKEAISDPNWNYGCGGIAGYFATFVFGHK